MENYPNYKTFSNILIHEIGHLWIEMIIEDEYDSFSIIGIELCYNTRIIFPEKGALKYVDLEFAPNSTTVIRQEYYKSLVNNGSSNRVKLTQICLLFGSLFRCVFANFPSYMSFGSILKEEGKCDLESFKELCSFQGVDYNDYFSEKLFHEYFENIVAKIIENLRQEIVEFVNKNYELFNSREKTKNYMKESYNVIGVDELKVKIKSLDNYKEFVEIVKKYSFNTNI